jgi:hypothetical protein
VRYPRRRSHDPPALLSLPLARTRRAHCAGVRYSTAMQGVFMNIHININRLIHRSCMPYLPLLALFACGCEHNSFVYEYHGLLTHPGGTPAADLKVIAIHDISLKDFQRNPDENRWLLDHLSTTTDVSGRFRGECNGPGGYTMWAWDWFPPEVPIIDGVYVWVYDDNAWWGTYVPLNNASQQRSKPGVRFIELPPLSLPSDTRNHRSISGWYSPNRQEQKS